jgi:hypothetical protein
LTFTGKFQRNGASIYKEYNLKEINLELAVKDKEKWKERKSIGKTCSERKFSVHPGRLKKCEKKKKKEVFQRSVENSVGKVENKLKNSYTFIHGIHA